MKTINILIIIVFFIGCSNPNENTDNLDVGEALITIENSEFSAIALMGNQVLAETQFEKISLIINDSVKVEILQENFLEEQTIWTRENYYSQDILFSLQYNYYGGSPYSPLEGHLSINQRTELIISGEFEFTLTGGAYSCITCPEALRDIQGKFIVGIE
jgi:hypothetical protein